MGEGARKTYKLLRNMVPVLDEDRPLGPDIDRVQQAVASGLFNPAQT